MNPAEQVVRSHLERQGFRILRNGWPDFLALRKTTAGWEVMAVEVKNGKDEISEAQGKMHRALHTAHIPVWVARVSSDQVRLSPAPFQQTANLPTAEVGRRGTEATRRACGVSQRKTGPSLARGPGRTS